MAWLRRAPLDLVYRQRVLSLLELIHAYDGEVEVFRSSSLRCGRCAWTPAAGAARPKHAGNDQKNEGYSGVR
jgi:hypothetical protein